MIRQILGGYLAADPAAFSAVKLRILCEPLNSTENNFWVEKRRHVVTLVSLLLTLNIFHPSLPPGKPDWEVIGNLLLSFFISC